jgi:hypothetical protein
VACLDAGQPTLSSANVADPPRTQLLFLAADGCMSRIMRKPDRARLMSDTALLL